MRNVQLIWKSAQLTLKGFQFDFKMACVPELSEIEISVEAISQLRLGSPAEAKGQEGQKGQTEKLREGGEEDAAAMRQNRQVLQRRQGVSLPLRPSHDCFNSLPLHFDEITLYN